MFESVMPSQAALIEKVVESDCLMKTLYPVIAHPLESGAVHVISTFWPDLAVGP